MLNEQDLLQLQRKGISVEKFNQQMNCFVTGFPFLELYSAASTERGIKVVTPEDREKYVAAWDCYVNEGHTVVKFVPASGAASRMFKDLFAFLNAAYDEPTSDFEKFFFDHLSQMAFYSDLNEVCKKNYGEEIPALLSEKKYKEIVSALLGEKGLNYGHMPKGALKFHTYGNDQRTPFEEHLVEGALYAKGKEGDVNVHFTVSPEHRALFDALVKDKSADIEKRYGVKLHISFSEQKQSTDTPAANEDNTPFRNADGSILFRPGGHGALIENLNDIDADVVFIKNIDNVVPDHLKGDTVANKKLLAGILVSVQNTIRSYLKKLDSGQYVMEDLREMLQFIQKTLCCKNPETKLLEDTELAVYIRKKLNRPIRVCGMVKNIGEAGGGPFLAYNSDGTYSPQILESSQIDVKNPEKKAMFEQGTHFNPVDLVCAIKNYKGEHLNLLSYVDPKTGFISEKSKDGKKLKALELPGLWNGSMSDWNTIFVEVPLSTFNPVKTVNDLVRPQHQEHKEG